MDVHYNGATSGDGAAVWGRDDDCLLCESRNCQGGENTDDLHGAGRSEELPVVLMQPRLPCRLPALYSRTTIQGRSLHLMAGHVLRPRRRVETLRRSPRCIVTLWSAHLFNTGVKQWRLWQTSTGRACLAASRPVLPDEEYVYVL